MSGCVIALNESLVSIKCREFFVQLRAAQEAGTFIELL
jgi:hypothetical protein